MSEDNTCTGMGPKERLTTSARDAKQTDHPVTAQPCDNLDCPSMTVIRLDCETKLLDNEP